MGSDELESSSAADGERRKRHVGGGLEQRLVFVKVLTVTATNGLETPKNAEDFSQVRPLILVGKIPHGMGREEPFYRRSG